MTLDTNIIIAYMAGDEDAIRALSVWREAGSTLFLPAVAEAEVLAFGGWNDDERKMAEVFLAENFVFIPFDRSLTKILAKYAFELATFCAVLYTNSVVLFQ